MICTVNGARCNVIIGWKCGDYYAYDLSVKNEIFYPRGWSTGHAIFTFRNSQKMLADGIEWMLLVVF